MSIRPCPALALVLLAACGDSTSATSDGGTATGSGSTSTSTSGHVSTTSPTGEPIPTTGASDSLSGTTTTTTGVDPVPTGGTAETTTTGQITATDATTAIDTTASPDTTTTTGDPPDTTTTLGTTTLDTTTGDPGGCDGPGDCPAPGECLLAPCEAGVCGQDFVAAGDPCATGVCDGVGACVDCLVDLDCPQGQVCLAAQCAPPACDDNIEDGQETDIDCGGPVCPACAPGDQCQVPADCDSGVCTGQVCQAAACDDDLENGQETDVDCGGPTCPECQLGEDCLVDGDCQSGACEAGQCVDAGPDCAGAAADPATGQRCPIFMTCSQSSECGVFQGCQQWFCNNAKTCELNALSDCGVTKGGGCNAGVVFVQHDDPPVDKRFLPPDGVNFREVATLAFTVYNNTASDIYLDKLPVQLELMGGGSKFDVSSAKIFDNSGGPEHGPGDILVCLTGDPFSFPANGVLGPCAGSSFARVAKNSSNQFIVNLAFAKEKTYIAGRSYRLKLASLAGVVFKVGFNGPDYAGTSCGVPGEGFVGAWVTAQNP